MRPKASFGAKTLASENGTKIFGVVFWLFIIYVVLYWLAQLNDAQNSYMKSEWPNISNNVTEENGILLHACTMRTLCAEYGKVRVQCATAGNYDTCMSVLMGNEPYFLCNADGTYTGLTENVMPGKLQCFALKTFQFFRVRLNQNA